GGAVGLDGEGGGGAGDFALPGRLRGDGQQGGAGDGEALAQHGGIVEDGLDLAGLGRLQGDQTGGGRRDGIDAADGSADRGRAGGIGGDGEREREAGAGRRVDGERSVNGVAGGDGREADGAPAGDHDAACVALS